MNLKHTLKLLFVGLLSAGLVTAVACGDDPADDPENQDNQDNQENQENQDEPEEAPTCEDADPPERCSASADDFDDYGPATHVTGLEIADTDCCVDFSDGGDGDPDNGLAGLVPLIPDTDLDDINETIAESLEEGTINIVFEHAGLEEFAAGQEFALNFLIAEEVEGGEATIDPASFEEGVHPHAQIPGAELDGDDVLTAGPGTMILSLDIGALTGGELELDLDLTISEAQLTADAAASNGVEDGIDMLNGELGGLLMVEDIVVALNDFASDCDCLDNPDPLLSMEDGDPDTIDCLDAIEDLEEEELDETQNQCEDNDEELCGMVAEYCGMLGLIGVAADIDSNNDGILDAASVGLLLEGEATVITGASAGE